MMVLTGGMLDVKNTDILYQWHENFKEATALIQWFFTQLMIKNYKEGTLYSARQWNRVMAIALLWHW